MRKYSLLSIFLSLLGMSAFSFAEEVTPRHGYVNDPPSRAFLCNEKGGKLNKNCGAVQYEPQSIEGPKGFPDKGPADGKIASAGKTNFKELDEQTASRWHKIQLTTGKHDFKWTATAKHKTKSWRFYITKKNWNPDQKLTRAQFDLNKPLCELDGKGQLPDTTTVIKNCDIPADYKGYHVILGIWDIADTSNAFYQVIDADISK